MNYCSRFDTSLAYKQLRAYFLQNQRQCKSCEILVQYKICPNRTMITYPFKQEIDSLSIDLAFWVLIPIHVWVQAKLDICHTCTKGVSAIVQTAHIISTGLNNINKPNTTTTKNPANRYNKKKRLNEYCLVAIIIQSRIHYPSRMARNWFNIFQY